MIKNFAELPSTTNTSSTTSKIRFLDIESNFDDSSWIKYADSILTQYRYRVEIKAEGSFNKLHECDNWCKENCLRKYESHVGYDRLTGDKILVYAFEKRIDATAFKLACS